jgi:RNA polymerase sigma-70 factor (ECF subfamily)
MTSLEQLYDAHAKALYVFLLNVSRSSEVTRDILQTVFLRVAAEPELLASIRHPRAYLLRMAHRAWIDLVRRDRSRKERYQQFSSSTPSIFEPASETHDLHRVLKRSLASLPEAQRAVDHLHLWEDLTFEQIGDTLGISKSTAVSRFRYALDKLRAQVPPDTQIASTSYWSSEIPTPNSP